ncbi:MAG: hypothetical protein KGL39_35740 [Patescibacteria group bacterium]|nr:hypothetical protein [Patescibacteria group bacterium]
MAATSGIFAVSGQAVSQDLLKHILPNSSTVATAVTITGAINMELAVGGTSSNTTAASKCSDTNYAHQAITWNSSSVTSGTGSAAGFASVTNNGAVTFFGATGAAAAQTIYGVMFYSSDATPVAVMYENFSATVSVPQGNQYTFASGTGITNQIG